MTRVFHRLSLSQRLLVMLIVVSFAYWSAIAWFTLRDSIDVVYELFDAHLENTADSLLRVVDPDDINPAEFFEDESAPELKEIFSHWPDLTERLSSHPATGENPHPVTADTKRPWHGPLRFNLPHSLKEEYLAKQRFQIWDGHGQLLMKSANAPVAPMTERDGFSESVDEDEHGWRHYAIWDIHHDFRIVVSESHDVRNRLIRSIALHMVSPLALGLPVLIVMLWLTIRRKLDPLATLTREIEAKRQDNLDPLREKEVPEELQPMVLALNDLLRRIGYNLEGERRFTANAAHELRTPLATIQAQIHVARSAENAEERDRSMDQLQLGVDRGIRLVGQLLTMARLDPDQTLLDVKRLDPGELAQDICAELAPLALQRQQVLELKAEPNLPSICGNADLLTMLIGNLIDNAIRYTPEHGHITLAVSHNATSVLIEVSDDGPGIPAAVRKQVFERFYRIAGNDQPGNGLGLAICRRIAELHRASITLNEGHGGKGVAALVSLPICHQLQ
jgi:two-component system sensor histidine kinase QseC